MTIKLADGDSLFAPLVGRASQVGGMERTERTAGRCRALVMDLSLGRIRNRDKLTSLPGAITLLVVFDFEMSA
jgi:hypothetical protein